MNPFLFCSHEAAEGEATSKFNTPSRRQFAAIATQNGSTPYLPGGWDAPPVPNATPVDPIRAAEDEEKKGGRCLIM